MNPYGLERWTEVFFGTRPGIRSSLNQILDLPK